MNHGTAKVQKLAPIPPSRIEGGKTCAECRWFCSRWKHEGGDVGECRKGPPQPYFHAGIGCSSSSWPTVDSAEWCGAWAAVA